MRRPCAPGTPIDAKRFRRWISRFGSYRDGVTNLSIENWLHQFETGDHDLAARVLDAVEYYGNVADWGSLSGGIGWSRWLA